jgi:hypothetical protein
MVGGATLAIDPTASALIPPSAIAGDLAAPRLVQKPYGEGARIRTVSLTAIERRRQRKAQYSLKIVVH